MKDICFAVVMSTRLTFRETDCKTVPLKCNISRVSEAYYKEDTCSSHLHRPADVAGIWRTARWLIFIQCWDALPCRTETPLWLAASPEQILPTQCVFLRQMPVSLETAPLVSNRHPHTRLFIFYLFNFETFAHLHSHKDMHLVRQAYR